MITHGSPETRLNYLENNKCQKWQIEIYTCNTGEFDKSHQNSSIPSQKFIKGPYLTHEVINLILCK